MYNLLMETEKGKFYLKLTAGISKENEKELYESTYAHSSDTACETLLRRRKKGFRRLIDEKDFLPERITKSRYDFKFMANGILLLILGFAILITDIPTIKSGNRNFGILIFSLIFALCLVIFGSVLVLRPTQILVEKMEWSSKKDKFRPYLELKSSYADHTLVDGIKNGISRISEMNFYDNGVEYISGNSIVFMEYEYLESVFETENYFVIMVQNRDIFPFVKSEISSWDQQTLREVLSSYYK